MIVASSQECFGRLPWEAEHLPVNLQRSKALKLLESVKALIGGKRESGAED
jgi:hypothetical protein